MDAINQPRRNILHFTALAVPAWLAGAASMAGEPAGIRTADGKFRFYGAPDGIHWSATSGNGHGLLLPLGLSFALTPGSICAASGHLAYTALDRRTGSNIWTVPIRFCNGQPAAGMPAAFFHAATFDVNPVFSEDGRQIAYACRDAQGWKLQRRSFAG